MGFIEHLSFSQQKVDYRLLLAVEPAGQDDDEELPRLEDKVHRATDVGVGQCDRIEDLGRLSIDPDEHFPVGISGSWGQDLRFGGVF